MNILFNYEFMESGKKIVFSLSVKWKGFPQDGRCFALCCIKQMVNAF